MQPQRDRGDPLRSYLAQVAKAALFATYLGSGYVPLRNAILAQLGWSPFIVLCYHRIGGCDRMSRPADQFHRDLAYLKQHYECLSLAELARRLQLGRSFRRPAAVLTFDDGYRDNYLEAAPALLSAGVPATFFAATGYVGTRRVFPHDASSNPSGATFPLLTWDDLRAMQAAGFEIGSHTVNHVDLGRADGETIHREITDSLAVLNQELGSRPRAFAFPWGQPANVSAQAVQAIQKAGYYAAVNMFGGSNGRGTHPLTIQRIDAGNGQLGRLAWRVRAAGTDPDRIRGILSARDRRSRRAAVTAASSIAGIVCQDIPPSPGPIARSEARDDAL